MQEAKMKIRVKVNQAVVQRAVARRNISQNALAAKVGTNSGYLSQIMRGVRYPSPKVREKLQAALYPLTFDDIFIIEEIDDAPQNG